MIIHLIVGLTKKTCINEWIFSKSMKVELDSIYTATSYLKNATDLYTLDFAEKNWFRKFKIWCR